MANETVRKVYLGGALVKRSYGDPSWAEKPAQVRVPMQVSLYGLPIVRDRIARIELDSSLKLLLGTCPVPIVDCFNKCQRAMRFAQSTINFQGLEGRFLRFRKILFGGRTWLARKRASGCSARCSAAPRGATSSGC